ncbi:MAG: poly(R)-hydroxyalkanoic acid synthase subunit PhaE [Betaproteobacteria bacterium]
MSGVEQKDWAAFWLEKQKNMLQSWIEGKGIVPLVGSGAAETAQDGMHQINDLIKRSMEGWAALAPSASAPSGQPSVDIAALSKLFDPVEWSRAMSGGVDFSLEKLTEGPTYATISDLDRKILNAQRLWLQRAAEIESYRQVVQTAWNRAFERFGNSINDKSAPPLKSARAVLDLWLSTVNEALLEMHHLPEFLEAQRRMTRSASEYRLQERELMEAFCEANHIPTRTEMDEMQREVQDLKRELRAIKRGNVEADMRTLAPRPPSKRKVPGNSTTTTQTPRRKGKA